MVLDYCDKEDIELSLVLRLTHFPAVEVIPTELRAINWKRLFDIATSHKVAMLVYSRLSVLRGYLPEKEFSDFEVYCKKRLITNLQNTQYLVQIYKEAVKQGIEIIPYKGTPFAKEVYGGVELRGSSDIDFWFPVVKRSELKAILAQMGFKPGQNFNKWGEVIHQEINCEYTFIKYHRDVRTLVEPHYFLINHFLKIPLSLEEVKNQLLAINISGNIIKTFSPSMMLVYLATHHGATEGWHKLKNYTDIQAFIHRYKDELDWTEALKLCGYYRVKELILIGMINAAKLYGQELPAEVKAQITPKLEETAKWVLHTASIAFGGRARTTYKISLLWRTRSSWADRLRLIYRIMYYTLMRGVYTTTVKRH